MGRQAHRGFTLVELLVVITIIGILVGLLMPAIVSARRTAQRAACFNKQKELSVALLQYETQKQSYPGFVEMLGSAGRGKQIAASWCAMVLPFLGREDVWMMWRTGDSSSKYWTTRNSDGYQIAIPDIKAFACPVDSNNNSANTRNRPLSYVANCGYRDNPPSKSGQMDLPANGIFQNRYDPMVGSNCSAVQTVCSSDVKDGTAQTLLFSENLQAGQWADPYCDSSSNPGSNIIRNLELTVGMIWTSTGLDSSLNPKPNTGWRINDLKQATSNRPEDATSTYTRGGVSASRAALARPSSNHPGGVVASFCDGHQLFLREEIDYYVYQLMMTPDGRNCRKPSDSSPQRGAPWMGSGSTPGFCTSTLSDSDLK